MRTTIELVSSEDGGRTWSEPIGVSPTVRRSYSERRSGGAAGVFGTLRVVQGSQPVVGPDGTVHVAWLDSTDDESQKGVAEITTSRSTDAGRTWTPPTVASVFNEIEFRPRTNFFRVWAAEFPQLAVGPDGELYIVYTGRPSDKPDDDGDIFIVSSTDEGDTWTRPLRLNDDDSTHLQFFPSVDVDPNGSVHVMWGDMRDSPTQSSYFIYYTSSEDKGETLGFEDEELGLHVGDTRVSDFPSNPNYGFPNGLFIGDYFSIAATEEDVYMVWADTRLGEFGRTNQKIGFARQEAVPQPEMFLSPPAGPAGQEVDLQGFDFQPELDVFVQLGDSTDLDAAHRPGRWLHGSPVHAHHERGQPDPDGLRRVGQRGEHLVLHRVRHRQHPRQHRGPDRRLDDRARRPPRGVGAPEESAPPEESSASPAESPSPPLASPSPDAVGRTRGVAADA